ncbi:hypothetical protein D9M69_569530 [compost metagenome]
MQAGGQLDAADRAGGLVVLPARADQVAAGHRFHQDGLQPLDHDGAAAHLVDFVRRHHVFGLHARGVVRQDMGQLLQPELGQFGQHLPLAGDGVVEDHVEGGDAIRRDDQQLVVAHRVHIAHLTAAQQRQGLDAGLMQSRSHGKWPMEIMKIPASGRRQGGK